MVCVNELSDLHCHKRKVLEPLLIILTPFAPHLCEELWHQLGNDSSVLNASYPICNETYLLETEKEYPVSVNGKLRTNLLLSLEASQTEVEEKVIADEIVKKWLDGKPAKKIIFVKGKMINVVV